MGRVVPLAAILAFAGTTAAFAGTLCAASANAMTSGDDGLPPLPNEAETFGALAACIVGRYALWPDIAPEETGRDRGHYVFDEARRAWRMRDVTGPEIVLLKPRQRLHL